MRTTFVYFSHGNIFPSRRGREKVKTNSTFFPLLSGQEQEQEILTNKIASFTNSRWYPKLFPFPSTLFISILVPVPVSPVLICFPVPVFKRTRGNPLVSCMPARKFKIFITRFHFFMQTKFHLNF